MLDVGTARCLIESVLRPLADAIGTGTPGVPRDAIRVGHRQDSLWELAAGATELRTALGSAAPVQLEEAVAALQDLAVSAADDPDARLAELRRLQASLPTQIEAAPDGPYLVTNPPEIRDWLGTALPTRPQMALCRCGSSATKPLCDGTHAAIGFRSDKDPNRVPDRRDAYEGVQITVLDNRGLCQHSGFCTDRLATVFRADQEPFVAPSGGRMDEIIRAVRDCPSGALSYAIDGHEQRREVDWDGRREASITVTKDGPYRVTGNVALRAPADERLARNHGASHEHYALCRCGHSQNKPFCSGMHWYVEFRDPVPNDDHEPTVFEWCGGLPALTRMTRLFYERSVPEDPLLAPLFADMRPDHPQRVAEWLGEVFGGPKRYSDTRGGYPHMVHQHLGKGLTEEQRARWVQLLVRSADDAGLPRDPEFRATFTGYLEWGSRVALENSQPGARPPEQMPMPKWGWGAAGPPTGRVSSLQSAASDQSDVVLPGPDEAVSFERHIKQLFRSKDRQSMKFAFDLWSHDAVATHAEAILEQLQQGSMPCDGAWSDEWVATFRRWVEDGTAA